MNIICWLIWKTEKRRYILDDQGTRAVEENVDKVVSFREREGGVASWLISLLFFNCFKVELFVLLYEW